MAPLTWTTDEADVPAHATEVTYAWLYDHYIRPALNVDTRRSSLQPPAAPLLAWLDSQIEIAVTDVAVTQDSLAIIYGYLAEPAYRRGVTLTIVADRDLDELTELESADADVGYPWSLGRLQYLLARPGAAPSWPPATSATALDDSQRQAASAHDGVVQIIAPAGSGKTTVLVARAGHGIDPAVDVFVAQVGLFLAFEILGGSKEGQLVGLCGHRVVIQAYTTAVAFSM